MKRVVFRVLAGGVLLLTLSAAGLSRASAHQEAAHPAHIHNGTCDTLGDVIAPLNDVASPSAQEEGSGTPAPAAVGSTNPVETDTSVTTVKLSLADLIAGEHSINVHRSADDISNYIACGEIGGVMTGSTDLAVALRERNNSHESGIALLHDNGDGTTTVTLMLVQSLSTAAPVATPSADNAIDVTLNDFRIAANATSLKVGVPYTFVATNDGVALHELVIEHFGDVDSPIDTGSGVAEAADIIPGSSATMQFTFSAPGKYQIACHLPGHFEAGMVLEIDVTA